MCVPGKVLPATLTPEEIRDHLVNEHQLEAPIHLSITELNNLHIRLHEDDTK